MSLDEWRHKLDEVDGVVWEAIEKRRSFVAEVAREKRGMKGEGSELSSGDVVRPMREREMLRRVLLGEGGLFYEGCVSLYGIWRHLIATGYRDQGIGRLCMMAEDREGRERVKAIGCYHFGAVIGVEEREGFFGIESGDVLGLYGVPKRGGFWWRSLWEGVCRPYVRGALPQVSLGGGEGDDVWSWEKRGKFLEPPVWLVTNCGGEEEVVEGEVVVLGVRVREGEKEGVKMRMSDRGCEMRDEVCEGGMWHGLWWMRGEDRLRGEIERECEEAGCECRVLGGYPLPIEGDERLFFGVSERSREKKNDR